MKDLLTVSIISSVVSIILLIYVINKQRECTCKKENLLLCDNMGNAIYKDVDYSPFVYNYPNTEFGF
jgi:hypothetical protein